MPASRYLSFLAAVLLGASLIVSAALLARVIPHRDDQDDTIRVTGSARRIVRSDYIIWTATVAAEAPTATEAYQQVKVEASKLDAYLVGKGLTRAEIFPLAITTQPLYEKPVGPRNANNDNNDANTYRKVVGYTLSQDLEVRSKQVELVQGISRTATDLIKQGISLQSGDPQYLVTTLPELKDALLTEAATNAHVRAQQIAQSSGGALGGLKFSHMGLILVTGAYDQSEEASAEDTASLDKRVTVQVTSAFSIR